MIQDFNTKHRKPYFINTLNVRYFRHYHSILTSQVFHNCTKRPNMPSLKDSNIMNIILLDFTNNLMQAMVSHIIINTLLIQDFYIEHFQGSTRIIKYMRGLDLSNDESANQGYLQSKRDRHNNFINVEQFIKN